MRYRRLGEPPAKRKKLFAKTRFFGGAHQPSGARYVRPHGWQKKTTDEKKLVGAEALNLAGKTTPLNYLPILQDDCEPNTTTPKTIANKINLAFRTANVQKMRTGRPSYESRKTHRLKPTNEKE